MTARGAAATVALALLAGMAPAATGADLDKVLRVAFIAPENGFDPQASSDLYSNYVNRAIFDPLYKYDHLARPYKIVPNTAAALPEISADGLTWTIRIKHGLYFSDDPAFKGTKRELVAEDYVYSFKRLIDPRLRSNNAQILDDRLVGAKAAIDAARKAGTFGAAHVQDREHHRAPVGTGLQVRHVQPSSVDVPGSRPGAAPECGEVGMT